MRMDLYLLLMCLPSKDDIVAGIFFSVRVRDSKLVRNCKIIFTQKGNRHFKLSLSTILHKLDICMLYLYYSTIDFIVESTQLRLRVSLFYAKSEIHIAFEVK